jgi:hypothetical protein
VFFDNHGAKRLVCHAENVRHHAQVIQQWANSICQFGFNGAVRGTPIAISPESGQPGGPLRLIAAASMSQACYLAFEKQPLNPVVQHTLKAGFAGVQKLKHDLPLVLLRWVRDFHNSFHGGAGVSFLEVMKAVMEADAGWSIHAHDMGIGSRDPAFQTKCFGWLTERYPCKFSSMSQFKAARAMVKKTKDLGWKDDFEVVIGEICDFRNKSLSNAAVLLNMHALVNTLSKYIGASSPELDGNIKLMALEALKFMVPL